MFILPGNLTAQQIDEDEMGEACSMYTEEQKNIQDFGGAPEQRNQLKYVATNARIILKWILQEYD
jgi:hypothetical protein